MYVYIYIYIYVYMMKTPNKASWVAALLALIPAAAHRGLTRATC